VVHAGAIDHKRIVGSDEDYVSSQQTGTHLNTSITNSKVKPASRTSTVTGVLFAGCCVGKRYLRAKRKKAILDRGVKRVVYVQKQEQLIHYLIKQLLLYINFHI